jgi:hypothetical protein
MSETNALIPDLMRETFADPQGAARRIIGLDLPSQALWEALILVVVLSVIAAQVSLLVAGPGLAPQGPGGEPMMLAFTSPLGLGIAQAVVLAGIAAAVHVIGRGLGGMGRFDDALALVVWLQFLLVCLQVVQALLGLVAPVLSGLVGIVGIFVFFWLLTQFVMVLHGFGSAPMVFVMILVSMLALTFAISLLLTLFGFAIPGDPQNV